MIYLHHFLQFLKPASFQILDAVFSSYVSLFTKATVDKVLRDTWENPLNGSLVLQVETNMELLEVCMKTIHFYVDE
jgi:hypothetical protein